MTETMTIAVSLAQRERDSTPNCWHFASAYEALLAHHHGLVWGWNEATCRPGRHGQDYERLTKEEFLTWARGS